MYFRARAGYFQSGAIFGANRPDEHVAGHGTRRVS